MAEYKLGEVESRFADIIWEKEPLSSRELAVLAEDLSDISFVYSYILALCDRKLYHNFNICVKIVMLLWCAKYISQ